MKFTATAMRMTSEYTHVTVEAETKEEALRIIEEIVSQPECEWSTPADVDIDIEIEQTS